MMDIREVQSAEDITAFHKLPFRIYRNDKYWVPHLKQDVEKVFQPGTNKLFRDGSIKRWLLRRDGEVIGRIAAFVNPKYAKSMKQPTGGMGFFECIEDKDAAFLLFDTAIDYLKGKGMEAVDGPINFGEKDRFWGLQIENFDAMPSYGMNYNPEYYVRYFEEYGFNRYYEQLIYARDIYVPAQEVFVRKYNQVMSDPAYRIANVRGRSVEQIAYDFMTVYNNAWGGFHGFKPMPQAQALRIIKAMKPVLDPDIVVFVYYNEKPIAFYVNIPELNEIFRHVKGNLNLWGKLVFLYHKLRKTPRTMVGMVFGVDREFHGKGVEGAMIKWTELHIVTLKRYDHTIMTWIGDFNPKMLKVVENLGATVYRKLATYRYLFDRTKPFERMPIVQ